MFRVGLLNSDGTITWQGEQIVKPATANILWAFPSIKVSTTNQVFICYWKDESGSPGSFPFCIRSSGTDYSTWTEDTQLHTGDEIWNIQVVSMDIGRMYVAYWTSALTGLFGRLYSSGWGTQETITSTQTNNTVHLVADLDIVHVFWHTGNQINYATRTISWGAAETVFTGLRNTIWSSSYDTLNNELYIYYYNQPDNQVLEVKGKGGAWGASSQIFTTTGANSSMAISSYYQSISINASAYVMGVFWTENNSPVTDFEIKFGIEWGIGQASGGGGGGGGGGGQGAVPGGIIAVPDVPWEPFAALWIVQSGFILIPHISRKRKQRGNILEKI